MARRPSRRFATPEEPQHRINRMIRFPEVLVIDAEGEQLGVMSPDEARSRAAEAGLDLVEVAPNSRPPVCRIMDYGKFKYDTAKKKSSQATSVQETKVIQMRPKTDDHDLEVKLARAIKFLDRGDRVRFVMRLRGREHAYPGRWIAMLREHYAAISEHGKVTGEPSHQGRTISMLIEPVTPGSGPTKA